MATHVTRDDWFKTRSGREALTFYLFMTPWLIGFVFLSAGMILAGLGVTFTNYDGLMELKDIKFVGWENYQRVVEDRKLELVFQNTVKYAFISVPLGVALQLGLANLLNQRSLKGRGVFRTLYYVPSVMPMVAAVIAFLIMFDKNTGLVNAFLSLFEPGTAINWQLGGKIFNVLILLTMWQGIGSGMVIFLAGLQGIPNELKEAAMIDGANGWRIFLHITVPLLSPVVFFQLIMGIIYSMQVLMQPLLLSSAVGGMGGHSAASLTRLPKRAIYMWTNHAMYQIFGQGNYGYGVILLWMMFLVVALLSAVVFLSARYWVHYEVDQT